MKRALCFLVFVLLFNPSTLEADPALFLNAFGETSVAYLNESYLLLAITADSLAADILEKERARTYAAQVQKRIQIVREKLKLVSQCKIAQADKELIKRLDAAYACLDNLAWAVMEYAREKAPDTGERFGEQRAACVQRIEAVREFYSTLPESPGAAEPLITR